MSDELDSLFQRLHPPPPPRKRKRKTNAAPNGNPTAGYDLGDDAAVPLPVVDVSPGKRPGAVLAGIGAIAGNQAVYVRAMQLVRVVRSDAFEGRDARGVHTDPERLLVMPVDREWLSTELARRSTVCKWNGTSRKLAPAHPPDWLAPAVLAADEDLAAGVRVLHGITSAPVLRMDGTVWATPGFDTATGVLLAQREALPPLIPAPSRHDALAALAVLREPFALYPWGDEFGESVALSLVLTRLARHLMDTSPLFVITAPFAGSGKTRIAEVASVIADGVMPSLCTWPGDDEEMRKTLSSMFLAAEPFVAFDNVPNGATLRSPALDRVLTTRRVSDRRLGSNELLRLTNDAVFVINGNNIGPSADTVRRVLVARIDPGVEQPWLRVFEWSPTERALEQRPRMLAAAVTILSAHLGNNAAPIAKPMQSFEQWSRIVRDAIVWLGLPDPVASQAGATLEDPDASDRAELFQGLRAVFDERVFTSQDIERELRDADRDEGTARRQLWDAMRAQITTRSIKSAGAAVTASQAGYVLRALRGQIAGPLKLERYDQSANRTRWLVTRRGE